MNIVTEHSFKFWTGKERKYRHSKKKKKDLSQVMKELGLRFGAGSDTTDKKPV